MRMKSPFLVAGVAPLCIMKGMRDNLVIRPYRAGDRAVVREICRGTADRGRALPKKGPDGELVADLVTGYYTDIDARWNWVAEDGGRVIGYLTAAIDTRVFRRAKAWRIVPGAVIRALCRGFLVSRAFGSLVKAFVRRRGLNVMPVYSLPERYPAHIHINLLDGYRGRGLGPRLMAASISQLEAGNVSGVHATVRADNPEACRFFERMGFTVIDGYGVVMPCEGGTQDVRILVYGRRLAA